MVKKSASLNNLRSRSTVAGRCLQCWACLLCTVTAISLIWAYVSFVKSCDYMGVSSPSSPCRKKAMNSDIDFANPTALAAAEIRQFSDEEIASHAVARDVLSHHTNDRPAGSKIAFMFMTPGPLPLEAVWETFFTGHEGLYSVYVHASESSHVKFYNNYGGWKTSIFEGRAIPSKKVFWGRIEMVDAERRLLSHALLDPANMFFVLLSDTCIPLFDFTYVYAYLMGADKSYVESFDDPGVHGRGRYLEHMGPEIVVDEWRKGPQWIALHRAHAMIVVLDRVYYKKFKTFCKPGVVNNNNFNCVADEHYIPTLLNIMDPYGVANRSLTYADWSEGHWHPRAFGKNDVSPFVLMEMQSVTSYQHVTSEAERRTLSEPCLWNGEVHGCFLFARKFAPDTVSVLQTILPSLAQTSYTR